jgi:hypothetical protein
MYRYTSLVARLLLYSGTVRVPVHIPRRHATRMYTHSQPEAHPTHAWLAAACWLAACWLTLQCCRATCIMTHCPKERGDNENHLHLQFVLRAHCFVFSVLTGMHVCCSCADVDTVPGMRWPKTAAAIKKFKDKILRPRCCYRCACSSAHRPSSHRKR